MHAPLVSIIIPVFNGSNYLKSAIESALAQTYENCEVIVINDGSNDNGATAEIALSFEERIRYFEKENGGVSTALNEGIRRMRGEYFSWLSHDDIYLPQKIETQVNFLGELEDRYVILYSDHEVIDSKGKVVSVFRHPDIPLRSETYYLLLAQNIHGCSMLIPREAFRQAGGFDETLPTTQDYDLWVRLSQLIRFCHAPSIVMQGRVHEEQGSLTAQGILNSIDDYYSKYFDLLTPEYMAACFNENQLPKRLDDLLVSCSGRGSVRDYVKTFYLSKRLIGRGIPLGSVHIYQLLRGLFLRHAPKPMIEGGVNIVRLVRRMRRFVEEVRR